MIHDFSGPDELAEALAQYVAVALTNRLVRDGVATLAISGGQTPVRFLQALSCQPINWRAVTVTLVDDHWVPESSPRSNAAMVRGNLLRGPAEAARFVPLVNDAATPEAGRDAAEAAISALALPFAVVVLGMGNDGHTASFFPGNDRLISALAPINGQSVETIRAEAAGEPRITLTLPVLLEAENVALHIEGTVKRKVLNAAFRKGNFIEMPICAILAHRPTPDIFWCP
jgi:6-phosphogluconolactonase